MHSSDAFINAVGVGLGNAGGLLITYFSERLTALSCPSPDLYSSIALLGILYSWIMITVIFACMGISVLIWPKWRYHSKKSLVLEFRGSTNKNPALEIQNVARSATTVSEPRKVEMRTADSDDDDEDE